MRRFCRATKSSEHHEGAATAKEELESTNEELHTVNEELHNRNFELTEANTDLVNLLSSVNIAMVMLGRDLRIRRVTPGGGQRFGILLSDLGRADHQHQAKY